MLTLKHICSYPLIPHSPTVDRVLLFIAGGVFPLILNSCELRVVS